MKILMDLRATELVAPEEAKRRFDDAAKLSRIDFPSYLGNAVTYYRRSTQAETIEEQLIDLVISLESLFTLDVQELRYRLSLRTSYLLYPQDKMGRKEVFNSVYSAYDLRSKILHKGTPLNREDHMVVSNVRQVVRDSIFTLVMLRQVFGDKNKLVSSIDSTIIEGGSSGLHAISGENPMRPHNGKRTIEAAANLLAGIVFFVLGGYLGQWTFTVNALRVLGDILHTGMWRAIPGYTVGPYSLSWHVAFYDLSSSIALLAVSALEVIWFLHLVWRSIKT
jgi:hypothetical protein